MVDYRSTTARDMYGQCFPNSLAYAHPPLEQAKAWVEACNVEKTWKVMSKWFGYMQTGEAAMNYPDPFWEDTKHPGRRKLTQDIADKVVQEVDEDFEIERGRFPRETGLGPEFSRLPPQARMALAQELYSILMTDKEIAEEADRLLARGITQFPPRDEPALGTAQAA